MDDKKVYDANGNEVNISKESFTLCQVDKKIHDSKFETKPTTFAKDAFKRFCKNKSSVVGAIIVGLLLLFSFILPLAIPHDISKPNLSQAYMPSKLFPTGTGFWDGTRTYKNIIYDPITESPAGFKKNGVYKILDHREVLADQSNEYAMGGILVFRVDNKITAGQNPEEFTDFLRNYTPVTYTQTDNIKLTVEMTTEATVTDATLTEYRIVIQSGTTFYVIKDWSTDYSTYTVDISAKMAEQNLTTIPKGQIRFEAKPSVSGETYIGIRTVTLTTSNEELSEVFDEISFEDANRTARLTRYDDGTFPVGYWHSSGRMEVNSVQLRYVDFIYSPYDAELGDNVMLLGKTTIDPYIEKGWCKYDYKKGPESFERLSDKCPIVSIESSHYDAKNDIYNITAVVTIYKYNGYSSMPSFLFGTDNSGYDIIKLSFVGLRASLLLSIIVCAVCFLFGLCWGAISGYYGGNIDLIMERFCDILGGVPWIVVMTLAILHLGNNIVTFGMALCLTGWMSTAARTRTQFYRFKGREYILASRTLGARDSRLIFKHILPNALGTLVTSSVLMIPSTIFSEATLAYLNLGLQGSHSLGNILSTNQIYLNSYPSLILFPAAIISLLMISFNLFGNGLRDALNPSLKGSE
ncbi:MAG: ABC transporter permease [Anaeroplasmataceae bacterium]|nr:ABC transporter permease [Anaeroplasmataceae bacterium]